MKKNLVQDVVPPKKSIRNVSLPSRSKKITPTVSDIRVKTEPTRTSIEETKVVNRKNVVTNAEIIDIPPNKFEYEVSVTKSGKTKKYLFISLAVILLVFVISSFFRSAEITVASKQEIRAVDEVFTAEKNVTSAQLGFQTVSTVKEIEKTVEATLEETVNKKASGTIIIYNNTSEVQKLVATTRFESSNGLIYRAKTPVTVPARQIKDGKTVAGTAEVVVEADITGEKYNIPLSDFNIVGFKGTSKYTQIYARSKTAMSGGFSGVRKTAEKSVLDNANLEMEEQLKQSLFEEISVQMPSNFVLYKNSLSYEFNPLSQSDAGSSSTVLKKRGKVSAIIFDKTLLSKAILDRILSAQDNSMVKVDNLDQLNFVLNTTNFNPDTTSSISFNIKGDADIIWFFDENKLKSDLLGLSKKNAEIALSTYGNIKEAWIKVKPFWSQTIPNNPDKVKLVNTLED